MRWQIAQMGYTLLIPHPLEFVVEREEAGIYITHVITRTKTNSDTWSSFYLSFFHLSTLVFFLLEFLLSFLHAVNTHPQPSKHTHTHTQTQNKTKQNKTKNQAIRFPDMESLFWKSRLFVLAISRDPKQIKSKQNKNKELPETPPWRLGF